MDQFDPSEIMKTWMTPGMERLGQLQEALWAAATSGGAPKPDKG